MRRGGPVLFVLMALGGLATRGAEPALQIPPIPIHLDMDGKPVTLAVSGTVSQEAASQGQDALRVVLNADLSDLQRNLTDLLRAKLDQSEKCGDRIAMQDASLIPATPAATLTAHLHFEKFGCAKIAGREIVKRLVAGDGTVVVRLSPAVDEGKALRLDADVTSVDATGQLGEMLRQGPLGDALREKIRKSVVAALHKLTDFRESLPPAVREIVEIRGARFREGSVLEVTSEVRVPSADAGRLLDSLRNVGR